MFFLVFGERVLFPKTIEHLKAPLGETYCAKKRPAAHPKGLRLQETVLSFSSGVQVLGLLGVAGGLICMDS